ncbi:MAG: glycosyltransferase family 39 protein [Candidatus Woesearchaeota archaeon]
MVETIRKHWDVYLALLIAFVFFLTLVIGNNIEMAFDESRHAVHGVFMKQYFVTLLSGDWMSYGSFLNLYMQKNPNIGWYALYDPPFHAAVQGIFFLFFGISQFVANASNAFLTALLSLVFFFFARKYFGNSKTALICYALFLFNPFVFDWSRRNRVDLTAGFAFLAWYYLTFWVADKYLSLRFSSKVRIRFSIPVFIGALFLTAAGMTKYPSMIFAAGVMICSILYQVYKTRHLLKKNRIFNYVSSSGILSMVGKFAMQSMVFLVIAGPWLKYALLDNKMYTKVFWAGSLVGREASGLGYYLYYLTASVTDLYYITVFSVVALFVMFRKNLGNSDETHSKRFMAISIGVMIVIATFLISNRQLRYAVQFVPLLYIISFEGMKISLDWLSQRIHVTHILLIVCIAFMAVFAYGDIKAANSTLDVVGHVDYQLEEFISKAKDPSIFVNIKGHGDFEGSKVVSGHAHKYTPDLFVFKLAKSSKDYDDPRKMNRYVQIVYWYESQLPQNPEPLINSLVETGKQINTYLVLFRFDRQDENIISSLKDPLIAAGFSFKEMDYYIVLYKEI